jgi:uncharacterized protein
MKLVLVLVVLMVGIWLFKSSRRTTKEVKPPESPRPGKPAVGALDMVRCRQCELHLPRTDAIEGKQGVYCSLEHRKQAES